MDTDRCIQKLVRTEPEGSEHTQCKIEETVQYWGAQEKKQKKAPMNYRHALEMNNLVSNKRFNNFTLKINHKKWLTKLRDKQTQWDEPWRKSKR